MVDPLRSTGAGRLGVEGTNAGRVSRAPSRSRGTRKSACRRGRRGPWRSVELPLGSRASTASWSPNRAVPTLAIGSPGSCGVTDPGERGLGISIDHPAPPPIFLLQFQLLALPTGSVVSLLAGRSTEASDPALADRARS